MEPTSPLVIKVSVPVDTPATTSRINLARFPPKTILKSQMLNEYSLD